MSKEDDLVDHMMEGKTDAELDDMGQTIDKMTVETIRMVDDLIEFESDPTDAAYNVYFRKYVDAITGLKKRCPPVFAMMFDSQSDTEKEISTEVLVGDIGRAKGVMREYLAKKRKQGAARGDEEDYVDRIKRARGVVYQMAKDRKMDVSGLHE